MQSWLTENANFYLGKSTWIILGSPIRMQAFHILFPIWDKNWKQGGGKE